MDHTEHVAATTVTVPATVTDRLQRHQLAIDHAIAALPSLSRGIYQHWKIVADTGTLVTVERTWWEAN